MNRHPVTSTLLKSIGYETINDIGVLEVEFKGGEVYRYYDVPQAKYDILLDLNAKFESVGKYFNEYIKTQYRVERVNKTSDPESMANEAPPDIQCEKGLNETVALLRRNKPADRSDKARHYAVVITELEKAYAYFKTFVTDATPNESKSIS